MRQSFCLNSVASSVQISRSPLNRSPSKNLYSFSKGSRFPSYRSNCDNYYNLPSYLHLSNWNLSPKKLPKVSPNSRTDNRVLEVGPSFTMRPRTKVTNKRMSIQPQDTNPGAGAYQNPEALSPRGNYSVSKYQNTGLTLFNPKRSKRFLPIRSESPGPGRYQQVNRISNSGHYPLSQSFGGGKRFFDKERRVVKFQAQAKKDYTPGPGSYRAPSQFGLYDGPDYPQPLSMSRRTSRSRF